jgi:phosphoserine aminotransferase
MEPMKPVVRPAIPCFSSGPCAKRPGWTPAVLTGAFLGRSHRAEEAKRLLQLAINQTREILELPADFRVGIVPGSDTGAFELALWSVLGARASPRPPDRASATTAVNRKGSMSNPSRHVR